MLCVRWLWLVLVGGCSFTAPPTSQGDARLVDAAPFDPDALDAAIDAGIIPPDAFVCSNAGFGCPGGTSRMEICNSGCWVACTSLAAFTDQAVVAQICTAWGGKLAPIRDAAEQACVQGQIFPSQASWIGFEQAPGQTVKDVGWSWNSDGIVPSYTNWSSGQPNDLDGTESGSEQCAFMTTGGTWQDVPCAGQQFFRFSCKHD
jgi:hypothetical protein